MTEAEALATIERLTAADREPVLDPDTIDELVDLARRADAFGRSPASADWTPTFDVNAAAAEGWERKAGLAAGDFDYSDDAGSYSRQQVYEMCKRQAETYRKRALGSLPIAPYREQDRTA